MAIDERFEEAQGYAGVDPARDANALDYFGLWKLFDGLCDASFEGKNRHYALGNTPEQRNMGHWSDGRAVRTLEVKNFSLPNSDPVARSIGSARDAPAFPGAAPRPSLQPPRLGVDG